MRSGSISRYFWLRYGKTMGIYMAGLLVFMLAALFIMMQYTAQRVVMVGAMGDISIEQGHAGLTLYIDPSIVVGTGAYSFIVMVLAFFSTGRERQFFVSMSTSRYETLIGSFLFLMSVSAALAVAGGWLIPTLVRLILFLTGFATRSEWTTNVILTGGAPMWWRTLIISFLDMVEMAGWVTLVSYLLRRWWKVMLIIGAASIVTIILVATQLSSVQYVQMLAKWAINTITWLLDEIVPAMEEYFANTNLGFIALRKIAAGSVLTALSYPVMRWMKVG